VTADRARRADVRSVFTWSYEELSQPTARLFRLLSTIAVPFGVLIFTAFMSSSLPIATAAPTGSAANPNRRRWRSAPSALAQTAGSRAMRGMVRSCPQVGPEVRPPVEPPPRIYRRGLSRALLRVGLPALARPRLPR